MDTTTRERVPGQVIAAFVIVWIQVIFTGFGAFLLQMDISSRNDHGQEVMPVTVVIAGFFALITISMAATTVFAHLRYHWARVTIIGIEVVSGAVAVLAATITMDLTALAGIMLPAVVISSLMKDRSR
ncbi:MAG: hypothetical protein ACRD0P_27315, partial [Stackebrandtia sp.]